MADESDVHRKADHGHRQPSAGTEVSRRLAPLPERGPAPGWGGLLHGFMEPPRSEPRRS